MSEDERKTGKRPRSEKNTEETGETEQESDFETKVLKAIAALAKDMKTLKSEQHGTRQLVGILNERSQRKLVSKMFGDSFSKSFIFKCVEDIAKFTSRLRAEHPTFEVMNKAKSKLKSAIEHLALQFLFEVQPPNAQFINQDFSELKAFPSKKNKNSPFQCPENLNKEEFSYLLKRLRSWWSKEPNDPEYENLMCGCDGFGVALLTLKNCGAMLREVELDYRGTIIITQPDPLHIVISVGEGKSLEVGTAKKQLVQRLKFLEAVCKIVHNQEKSTLIGRIFVSGSKGHDIELDDNISFYCHNL